MINDDSKEIFSSILEYLIEEEDNGPSIYLYDTSYMHGVYKDMFIEDVNSGGFDIVFDITEYPNIQLHSLPPCINFDRNGTDRNGTVNNYRYYEIKIVSYEDAVMANQWVLDVLNRDFESHPFSAIGINLQYWGFLKCEDIYLYMYYELEIEIGFINNTIAISDAHDFYFGIFAKKIQRNFRKYLTKKKDLAKKNKAASIIQNKWRHVISNPSCRPCMNRLLMEFSQFK